jgi:hypothetical protein
MEVNYPVDDVHGRLVDDEAIFEPDGRIEGAGHEGQGGGVAHAAPSPELGAGDDARQDLARLFPKENVLILKKVH